MLVIKLIKNLNQEDKQQVTCLINVSIIKCFFIVQSELSHHLLLQNIFFGSGHFQCIFSSLQLLQLVLQNFHCYLQVKVKAMGSYLALHVVMGLVDLVSQYLLGVELIDQFSNL